MTLADSSTLFSVGFALAIIGVLIVLAAAIALVARGLRKGNTKSAGVIIIGPVPIIFGSDKETLKAVLTLAVVLTALLVAAMLIYYFLLR